MTKVVDQQEHDDYSSSITAAAVTPHSAREEEQKEVITPWWDGVPTRLLRKKTLVRASSGGTSTTEHSTITTAIEAERLAVHTLTFAMPSKDNPIFLCSDNKAQHPSTLRLDLGDVIKMVIPGYKPKSYSISALRDDEFDVTLKVYPNGRASGHLDRLQIGDVINTFGVSKHYYREDDPIITHVGIVAYGVGITEALPIATAELTDHGDDVYVTLLWAARTRADTFWHEEIQRLQKLHTKRFRIHYILSRDDDNDNVCYKGRIDANILRQVFGDWSNDGDDNSSAAAAVTTTITPRFLSVGTKEMMAQTNELLTTIGYPMPRYALLKKKGKNDE